MVVSVNCELWIHHHNGISQTLIAHPAIKYICFGCHMLLIVQPINYRCRNIFFQVRVYSYFLFFIDLGISSFLKCLNLAIKCFVSFEKKENRNKSDRIMKSGNEEGKQKLTFDWNDWIVQFVDITVHTICVFV